MFSKYCICIHHIRQTGLCQWWSCSWSQAGKTLILSPVIGIVNPCNLSLVLTSWWPWWLSNTMYKGSCSIAANTSICIYIDGKQLLMLWLYKIGNWMWFMWWWIGGQINASISCMYIQETKLFGEWCSRALWTH